MRAALLAVILLAACRSSESTDEPLRHFTTIEESCAQGNGGSCNQLGINAEHRANSRLAAMFYAKACRLGHKSACESLREVDPSGSIGR